MSTATVALLVAFGSTIGPLFLAHLTGRQRAAEKREEARQRLDEKREDWRRADEVADRLMRANTKTDRKLDEVRVLVDGNLTAAMQSELNSLMGQFALMKKVAKLTGETAVDPTEAVIEARIVELTAQLEDRRRAESRLEGVDK